MIDSPCGHTSPRRVPGFIECELPEELLLHVPGGPVLLSLNQTARAVWELCDGHRSIEAIALELTRRFHAPSGQILAAVQGVVQQLTDLGLIQPVSPAESPRAAPSG